MIEFRLTDRESKLLVVTFAGARLAEHPAAAHHFALEVDALAAFRANHARRLVAGEFFRTQLHPHPFRREQRGIRQVAVGAHLLCVLVGDLRKHFAGALFGVFERYHTYRAIRLQVAKSGGDFAEIAELQRALAQPASRDHRYGVGGATVDLDERHQALAMLAQRVVQVQQLQAIDRHAQSQDLPGADVAMGLFGQRHIFVKGFQGHPSSLSAGGRNSTSHPLLSLSFRWRSKSRRAISATMPPANSSRTFHGVSDARSNRRATWLADGLDPSCAVACNSPGSTHSQTRSPRRRPGKYGPASSKFSRRRRLVLRPGSSATISAGNRLRMPSRRAASTPTG